MFAAIPSVVGRRTVVRVLRPSRFWIALMALAVVARISPAAAQPSPPEAPASELVVLALSLVDAPYRYGGRTPAGFDCSGFVGYVFGESAGVSLPRRSEDIGRIGNPVGRGELAVGDLVFFNTLGRRYSHVGIYIGEGYFVHAPARGGRVRIERFTDPFWVARYNGARRLEVMPPGPQIATTASTPTAAAVESGIEVRITP
jgi:cell wall-associated NlpC family hydrolase